MNDQHSNLFNTSVSTLPTPAPEAPVRTDRGGTLRQQGDTATEHHVASYSQGTDMARTGDGILATARTAWGTHATTLTNDTRVTVEGQETTLQVAAALGLVRKDGDRWIETGRKLSDEVAAPATVSEQHPAQAFRDPVSENALADLVKIVPPQLLDAALVQSMTRSQIDHQLAENSGMAPAEFTARVHAVRAGYTQQAFDLLESKHIDMANFTLWAREKHPDELKHAMLTHVYSRSAEAAYGALAEQFLRQMPPDADTVRRGGLETRYDHATKRDLVKVNNMWTDVATAARLGFI